MPPPLPEPTWREASLLELGSEGPRPAALPGTSIRPFSLATEMRCLSWWGGVGVEAPFFCVFWMYLASSQLLLVPCPSCKQGKGLWSQDLGRKLHKQAELSWYPYPSPNFRFWLVTGTWV